MCIRDRLTGDFKPGKAYTVTIRKGLRAGRLVLPRSARRRVIFPDIPPEFRFLGEGFYLPRSMPPVLTLKSINLSKATVNLTKLYPQNVVEFVRDGYLDYMPAFTGKRFPPKVIQIKGERNRWTTTRLDLAKLLGKAPLGTFCVTVSNPERVWQNEQVLLQITDLGLVSRCSDKNILVWVVSLTTGTPVEGSSVRLLSRTNRVIAEGKTNEKGVVLFEGPFEKTAEEEPFLVEAKLGDDQAFLSLSRMLAQQEDGSFGRRDYPKGSYEAWVWTERGVYRPGEVVNVYAVVRDRYMSSSKSFPVRFEIVRPDRKTWKIFNTKLSSDGTCHASFSFPKYVPTGPYRIRVLGPEESVIGSRKILVEEIKPDRLRVRAYIEEKELRGGEKAHLHVSALHFFGKPASGNTVQAYLELIPTSFRPEGCKSYKFSNSEAENKDQSLSFLLGTKKLDENGEAVFEVELPAGPLCSQVYTAIFSCSVIEEGGRAVTCKVFKPLHLYEAYLGVALKTPSPSVGREVTFSIVALNPEGAPSSISQAVVLSLIHI